MLTFIHDVFCLLPFTGTPPGTYVHCIKALPFSQLGLGYTAGFVCIQTFDVLFIVDSFALIVSFLKALHKISLILIPELFEIL